MLPLPLPATARLIETEGITTTDSSSRSSRIESQTGRIRSCSSSNRRLRASSSRSARVAAHPAPVPGRAALECGHVPALTFVSSMPVTANARTGRLKPAQVELADRLADGQPPRSPRTPAAPRGSATAPPRRTAAPRGSSRCRSPRSRSGPRTRSGRAWRSPGRCRCPNPRSWPRRLQPAASSATRSRIATAIVTARSAGVVAGQRVVEEHHEPVAGEALEGALEPVDQLAERRVVLREHAHHLFGLARLGERGEAAQVAEHDHDLAPMAVEEGLVARVDHQVDQLRARGSGAAG